MAYEDDEDVWEPDDEEVQEEPDVPDDPADEQADVVEPEEPPPPPPEEPEPAEAPAAKKWMPYEEDEQAPPLAPDDRTEAPQPVRYAQNLATGTATDAGPEQPAAKKWMPYDDSEDVTPASAAAAATDGKKWMPYEEPEGAFATFGRELLHGAPPAVAGAVTGAATGAAVGAAGFNPLTVLGGTVAGGIAGGITADVVKDKALKALGHDDNALRAANAKENPWSAAAGTFLSNVFGGAAGFGKAVVTGTARAVGGVIGGGWETGSQIYQGKSLKEAIPPIAAATAGGTVFAGGRPWTRAAEGWGGRVGARFKPEAPAAAPEPAAQPPDQGVLPGFGTPGDKPFDVRDPTQEKAQIGGGEAQPELPGLRAEPPAPPKPGVTTQPELGLEPPPTINKEGQYGFSINAPHPDSTHTTPSTGAGTSRNPMPDAAGTAKEAAPPPQARQPNTAPIGSAEGPHSAVVRGTLAEPPPDAGSGIHVLQPGQLDSTVQAGIKARTASAEPPPRTTFEPPRGPEQGPPAPPSGEIIPRERALVPHRSESTQGVTETPVPGNHTRLYQGENQPPNTFTTNRQAAEAHGPVKSVDVHNEHGMPFFNPTNQPGHFTTKNEIYRQRAQPVEQLATQPVAKPGEQPPGPKPPPGGEPPPPAGIPPGAKVAGPDLETKLKGMPPEAPTSQPPIGPPGGIAPTTMPPTPGVPTKTAKAIAKSKAADKGPGEAVVGKTPYGVEIKAKYDSKMTLSEALAKHGTAAGLMDKVTKPVRDMVEKLIGNMPVHFMPNSEFRKMGRNNYVGLYHWQGDNISINNKYAAHPGEFARTIIHEAMHGVTSHAIGSVPEVRAAIKQIMFDVKSKHKPAGPTKYGFKNEREFVAEAFSNVAFQKMLADHVLSPKVAAQLKAHFDNHPVKSAWDAVVQTVRKVLGLKPSETSALEAVMKATAHAMAENPAAKAKYMAEAGMGKAQNYQTDGASPPPRGRRPEAEAAAPTSGKPTVTARDKFGNEAKFVGDTVHAAAAFAKGAGYKPNQIFNQDGTPYTPPKAAAQTTAQTGATPTQTAVPPGGGAGKPPGGGSPPAGGTPTPKGQPASSVEQAEKNMLARVGQKPPWYSNLPTSRAEATERWRKFYTAAKNAMDPIEQIKKKNAEGASLTPEEDFAMLARLTKGMGGRFQQMIKNGTYDVTTGKVNGKSLDAVIKPIQDNPDGFTAYALAKRTIELEGRGIKTGMNLAEARQIQAARAGKFEPVFRDLVEFQGRVLDNLVKTGVISHEAANKMRQLNKEYVPFYRMLDPKSELGQQLGAGLQTRNPIFKIKGSDAEVFDPIDSIIKNTYVFTDLAHRNQALVAMKNFNDKLPADRQFMTRDRSSHPIEVKETELQRWMDKHGIEGFADDTLTIFRPDAFRPADDKIRLFHNGKAEIYKVNPEIGKAVNAMDSQSQDLWLKIAATPARMLRAGAVLSPEFMLRNPLRDALTAFIQAKHGSIPFVDQYVGLKEIFKNSQHYQEWLINGGANANLVSLDRALVSTDPLSIKGVANVLKNPKDWLEPLRKISELSENATRVGMYKRAREKGVHQVEAAYEAREGTLDFSRMGAHGLPRALNAMIPFLNVHVEGLDRAARAFRDDKVGFLTKVGVGITTPSVLLWFRNKDDERVQQLPAWQRDLFWIVTTNDWQPISTEGRNKILDQLATKVGNLDISKLPNTFRKTADGKWEYNNGTIYRIPKPFELGVVFGSIPERMLDAYFKENPKAFNGLSKTMERALIPNYVPQAVLPFAEQWANRSLFLDRNLLTEQQAKLPPAQQFGPHTSETAKQLLGPIIRSIAGEKSSFGSPIIIDNYLRQWTGGLGKHVTDLIDMGVKSTKDLPPEPTKSAADMPGYKAFVARFPDRGAQAIQDFYDLRNSRKTEQAGIKELGKTDKAGAKEKAKASNADVGDSVAKQLKADRDAVIKITNDKNMSPDDKRAAIDLTYLLMIEHAKKGLTGMERVRRRAP